MRPLSGERLIYENLLCMYFSHSNDSILTEMMRERIAEFIWVCKANDDINGTCTVPTAEAIYSNWLKVTLRDIKPVINMSAATVYRFRIKMADQLKAFLRVKATAD